jgi:medium-chain acyl-[acyl-carrier-protein] hydrolase
MVAIDKKIIKKIKSEQVADYRILCIPYAGGGASFYVPWQNALNGMIDVLSVQLPGHEERFGEAFFSTIEDAANEIADAFIAQYDDTPFFVFGHSMGGLIGFEVTKRLEKSGLSPDYLFVSSTSPENFTNFVKSTELDDEAFLKRVMLFGGIDKKSEDLMYNDFFRTYLKVLRADFNIIENYLNDGEKIKTSIYGFCGDQDPMETKEKMEKWRSLTASDYHFVSFNGDHFYLKDKQKQLLKTVTTLISLKKFI